MIVFQIRENGILKQKDGSGGKSKCLGLRNSLEVKLIELRDELENREISDREGNVKKSIKVLGFYDRLNGDVIQRD